MMSVRIMSSRKICGINLLAGCQLEVEKVAKAYHSEPQSLGKTTAETKNTKFRCPVVYLPLALLFAMFNS